MTTIALIPEQQPTAGKIIWRAVAGDKESRGRTMGEALDTLSAQLNWQEAEMHVLVRRVQPDRFFTASQQQRLAELMHRWREARDAETELSAEEQAELEQLVEAEVKGAGARAEEALLHLSA